MRQSLTASMSLQLVNLEDIELSVGIPNRGIQKRNCIGLLSAASAFDGFIIGFVKCRHFTELSDTFRYERSSDNQRDLRSFHALAMAQSHLVFPIQVKMIPIINVPSEESIRICLPLFQFINTNTT